MKRAQRDPDLSPPPLKKENYTDSLLPKFYRRWSAHCSPPNFVNADYGFLSLEVLVKLLHWQFKRLIENIQFHEKRRNNNY